MARFVHKDYRMTQSYIHRSHAAKHLPLQHPGEESFNLCLKKLLQLVLIQRNFLRNLHLFTICSRLVDCLFSMHKTWV